MDMTWLLPILLFFPQATQTCNSNTTDKITFVGDSLNKKGFAIVELFTSEGCSSCPPADKLAAEIAAKAAKDGDNVFVLSEHVDYWNKIGWTDPFSSELYTQRQSWYADLVKDDGVYTPQMIVNGKAAFVGSDRQSAIKNINAAIAATAGSKDILISKEDPASKKYRYKIAPLTNNEVLHFVLVEKHVVSKVLKGENIGKTLEHDNVVRDWVTVEHPSVEGVVEFKNSTTAINEKFSIVAFVQDRVTGVIAAGVLR